jgi:hypothetical protein
VVDGRLRVQVEALLARLALAQAVASVLDHEHVACAVCVQVVGYEESLADVALLQNVWFD